MPSTATITSKTGPALTVTSLVLNNVTQILFRTAPKDVLEITCSEGIKEFDIAASTTVTATISSGVIAITVSQ